MRKIKKINDEKIEVTETTEFEDKHIYTKKQLLEEQAKIKDYLKAFTNINIT